LDVYQKVSVDNFGPATPSRQEERNGEDVENYAGTRFCGCQPSESKWGSTKGVYNNIEQHV